jgi:hypothetical protein
MNSTIPALAAAALAACVALSGCGSGKQAPKACGISLDLTSYIRGKSGAQNPTNDKGFEDRLSAASWPTSQMASTARALASQMESDDSPQTGGFGTPALDPVVYKDLATLLGECKNAAS